MFESDSSPSFRLAKEMQRRQLWTERRCKLREQWESLLTASEPETLERMQS